ncbi:uncharacterized protein LOC121730702 [Aricia agestis]|uniref:uncharacterized protein LOC121730702 n=1 Tax=Aricia agestis TaxID=91739 RepID=UPI001C20BFA6|nr:uncharacterized protein LOC121730702 [Aricia agestis]
MTRLGVTIIVTILLFVLFSISDSEIRDFSNCHDNFDLKPKDGILKEHTFTWLGFVQYLHVTTGLPHHSKAPRVVLIHKQYTLAVATDMLVLPRNYNLGKVIFGDYEQEELSCNLTYSQVKMGERCPRAYLEIPVISIVPHPEYTRFGVGNSLAIVKLLSPIKSEYMIPVCLPSVTERERKKKQRYVFMIDYINLVPRDFDNEKMGKKTLKMYTHKECRRLRMRSKLGSEGVTHVLCSSGCGVRPGSPIISHTFEGTFEVLGLAAGGGPCTRRSMRNRLNREPPLYVDVYPYTSWIINYITAQILPRPYPDNFVLADHGTRMGINREYLRTRRKQQQGWRARTYVTGDHCFKSIKKQRRATLFYSEKFEVNGNTASKLNIIMSISAGIETTIVCVRMLLPNRLVVPTILGVGGYNITVSLYSKWFPTKYYFSLGLYGKNTTNRDYLKWYEERKPGFW